MLKNKILFIFIGIGYFIGILSPHNFAPNAEFMPSAEMSFCVVIGLLYWICNTKKISISPINIAWLLLIIILLIQPILHSYTYPQILLYPFAGLVLAFLVSIVASNITIEREEILILGSFMLVASLATVLIQYMQLFEVDSLFQLFPSLTGIDYPSGFLFQRNQAAFVLSLSLVFCIYLIKTSNKKARILSYLCIIILSSAISITGSRTGIILLLFSILASLWYKKRKTTISIFFLSLLGFVVGSYLFSQYSTGNNIIERVSSGEYNSRISLFKESILNFLDNPIFGSGWGHFNLIAIDDPSRVDWFTYADHSHFFITQIVAELGLVGIVFLCFCFYIIYASFKENRKTLSIHDKLLYIMLLIFIIYSCTEFPLWIGRYLIIFSLITGILFQSKNGKKISIALLQCIRLLTLSFLFFIPYSYINFNNVQKIFQAISIGNKNMTSKVNVNHIENIPYIFYNYKDTILYALIPYSKEDLPLLLKLGEDIQEYYISSEVFLKQGLLYIANHDEDRAMYMLQRSCLINFPENCDQALERLKQFLAVHPEFYYFDFNKYEQWSANLTHDATSKSSM